MRVQQFNYFMVGERMTGLRAVVLLALLLVQLGGCAAREPVAPAPRAGDKPVETLDQRLQTLSGKYAITEPARRDAAQIRQQIGKLEEERQSLLKRYTEAHPSVVQVDRQIRLLRDRLEESERAP